MEKSQAVSKARVFTNYYKIKLGAPIFKYKVEISPSIPSNQIMLFMGIINTIRKDLNKKMNVFVPFNFSLYSPFQLEEEIFQTSYENVDYSVTITNVGLLDFAKGGEAQILVGRMMKLAQLSMNLKPVGRKYFNDKKAIPFNAYKIKIWPGCSTSVKVNNGTCMLNLDLGYKVLKEQTMLDYLEDLKRQYKGNMERIKEEIIGMTVITGYNNFAYRVEEVDTNMSPKSTFISSNGEEIQFEAYYEKRYNKKLSSQDQPLLVVTRKGKRIHLIPELCMITGLTERERSNFNLMKDLATVTKKSPQQRVEATNEFLQMFNQEPASKILKQWSIEVEKNTTELDGKKVPSGALLMGGNQQLSLENNRNLEREAQRKLLTEVELVKVGVFCARGDSDIAENFLSHLADSARTYNYPIRQPRLFTVDKPDWESWKRVFQDKLDRSVQFVILILPGRKKNAPLYDDIKRFFLSEMPIPTQVVLTETLKGKNERSIVNKILVQIAAKAGATPWGIDNMPFSSQPTMLVGLNVQSKGKSTLISFSGTVNRSFSKYWSAVEVIEDQHQREAAICKVFKRALVEFSTYSNNPNPTSVVLYREGTSEGQTKVLKDVEVRGILRAIEELIQEKKIQKKPEIFFVIANKRTGTKFYGGDIKRLENPQMGTVVDDGITSGKDFYLVSQLARQGTAAPTHFSVIAYYGPTLEGGYVEKDVSDLKSRLTELEILTYKMCYLYYNWLGSIRLPAPLKYAEILGSLMSKLEKHGNFYLPHEEFSKYKTLFYI